jgi:hypothetical protein
VTLVSSVNAHLLIISTQLSAPNVLEENPCIDFVSDVTAEHPSLGLGVGLAVGIGVGIGVAVAGFQRMINLLAPAGGLNL